VEIHKTNKYILSELKINPIVEKIQSYINKWVQGVRRMNRHRRPHFFMQYQPRGKRSKDDTSKDYSAVNGTGTDHED
jgi:hypothetical protein